MCSDKKKYLLMALAGVSLLGCAALISIAAKKKCCCKCDECDGCDECKEPDENSEIGEKTDAPAEDIEDEAAPEQAEKAAEDTAPVAETYVLNSARKVAHKAVCRYAKNDAERLTYTGDPEELISQGYRPCGT